MTIKLVFVASQLSKQQGVRGRLADTVKIQLKCIDQVQSRHYHHLIEMQLVPTMI